MPELGAISGLLGAIQTALDGFGGFIGSLEGTGSSDLSDIWNPEDDA